MNHNITFQHPRVKGGQPLTLTMGMDEISWAYVLNTASYPTYGGEVVQILSAYIDDMEINGMIRTYKELEEIYSFFIEYFTEASQGKTPGSEEKFNQEPMIMEYGIRGWRFEIQPLETPGFIYSIDTVAPVWQMKAHMVDKTPNVEKLQELVAQSAVQKAEQEAILKGEFSLTGMISPQSGEPGQNPFIAPGTFAGNKFEPAKEQQILEGLGGVADYYTTLLPAYLKSDFSSLAAAVGSKPAFGTETINTSHQSGSSG